MSNLTNEEKFFQQQKEMEQDLDTRINADNLPVANIMVAGITGAGKSTLINAIFDKELAATGKGKPITDHISEYENGEIPIHIWDTVGLELDSEKTYKSIQSIKSTIAEKATSKDHFDRVHAIWYCINSGCNRYQSDEIKFIKELYSIGVPFIIVLTQCDGDEDSVNAFESEIHKLNTEMGMENIPVVQVLALPVKVRGLPTPIPAFGLDNLVNVTTKLLPDFIKQSFIAAQKVSQVEKRNSSEDIICTYVRAAQHGFWDKVPIVNVFLTDSKIMKMFHKLAIMYNTVLPPESIANIVKNSGVDFKNNFFGLISPIDMGYSKQITELLKKKKEEGFTVSIADIDKDERAARMIAFYGYTFIDSIEELWQKLTEEQLKDINMVTWQLIGIINEKLKKYKAKVEE